MMTGLEVFATLLPWFRQDVREYCYVENVRWFQWGYIERGNEPRAAWYIFIRLPSYYYGLCLWSDEYRWMQRCLFFKEVLPNGVGSWQWSDQPCE